MSNSAFSDATPGDDLDRFDWDDLAAPLDADDEEELAEPAGPDRTTRGPAMQTKSSMLTVFDSGGAHLMGLDNWQSRSWDSDFGPDDDMPPLDRSAVVPADDSDLDSLPLLVSSTVDTDGKSLGSKGSRAAAQLVRGGPVSC